MSRNVNVAIPTVRDITPRLYAQAARIGEVVLHRDHSRHGAAEATRRAIVAAHQRDPSAEILLVEDDVHLLSEEIHAAIKHWAWPEGIGAVCFCDMREVAEGADQGYYLRSALGADGRGWWGNQCLLIRNEAIKVLYTTDWFAPWIETKPGVRAHKEAYGDGGKNCSDLRLGIILAASDYPAMAVHVPSLALHAGMTSECFTHRKGIDGLGERATRNLHPDLVPIARELYHEDPEPVENHDNGANCA